MSVGERLVPRFAERRWPQFAVAILGSVLSLGLLALLLVPSLTSVAAVEVVDGPETFAIGTAHDIEPAAGWSVQPSVERGALLPGDGLVLRSPDRVLTVSLREASPDERLVNETESHKGATASNTVSRVLTETLENGAELSHGISSVDGHFVAVLRVSGGGVAEGADGTDGAGRSVFIEARTDDPELLADYRAEIAALLLDVRAASCACSPELSMSAGTEPAFA